MERLATLPRWSSWVRAVRGSEHGAVVAEARRSGSRWPLVAALALVIAAGLVLIEMRTSFLEARVFSAAAARLSYAVEAGPSSAVPAAPGGPFDVSRGYARLPAIVARLETHGYTVAAQARSAPLALMLSRAGVFPIYPERAQAGLTIVDRDDATLFAARHPTRVYRDFDDIPPIIVRTLLFVENRELGEPGRSSSNPAIEWDRLLRAVVDFGWSIVDPRHPVSGGSTLATQLEKIRHSPDGRTGSVGEKARQIVTASLRAYRDGPDTLAARRRIVCDYLNALPLGARPEYGEVHGLLDGLRVWYGADPERVNRVLAALEAPEGGGRALGVEPARAFRQVLSLLLAARRPTQYLSDWAALDARTDAYLRLLAAHGVIPAPLGERARAVRVRPVARVAQPTVAFAARKASDAVRANLGPLVGDGNPYALDRLDLEVATTLDGAVNARVGAALLRLADPSEARAQGLVGDRLLGGADPARVVYSVAVYERGDGVNRLRVQADTLAQPLNVNESTKLELGSTAKLRTLITYLELVAELYERYAGMSPARLAAERRALAPEDAVRRWAIDWLARAAASGTRPSLAAMLDAALDRAYSASPAERFFTGGGVHVFANFDPDDDARVLTVREAFRRSVNLVFIRLMRDLVRAYMFRDGREAAEMLASSSHPLRRRYLERFADREGQVFLRRFYAQYRPLGPERAVAALLAGHRPTPDRLAAVFRTVAPEAGVEALGAFLAARAPEAARGPARVAALYDRYDPQRTSLADRAFVAGVHPLELWLVAYLQRRPDATIEEVVRESGRARVEAYRWLFDTRHKAAQDARIRTVLEVEAFEAIHRRWRRLGYPFDRLVPSYATAIGSSGDNPAALAELMGIILNDGVRQPTERIRRLRFAADTPYETILVPRRQKPEAVLRPEIARLLRQELVAVVEQGTAVRARGAWVAGDGRLVVIGGKTGTGDNRIEFGQGRRDRVLNRTAAFVFFVGDRLYGTVVAYVPGEAAGDYRFTSALPVQVFKVLVPLLQPLLERPVEALSASPAPSRVG